MFYVLNLSKPRKYIQWKARSKYDDIALEIKLHPVKMKKALFIATIVGVALIAGTTINAAEIIDQAQYNYLLDHFINNMKYPKELAEKLINKLSVEDFKELYVRVAHHNSFVEGMEPILEVTNKITGSAIQAIKSFIK
jgi:hypothetical protein